MSPSKDSQSDALNDWNAETYYYDSIRLYGRECQLQDNLSLLKKCPRHTDDGLGDAWSRVKRCPHYLQWSFTGVFEFSQTSCNIRYMARTAPEALSATSLLPPGVGQDDQLYLPSAPGTLKSGASSPKLDLNTGIFTECPWESTGMRIDIGFWGSTMLHGSLLI